MYKYFVFFLIFLAKNLSAKELSDCFCQKQFQRAHIGIYVLDLNTQKPIYQRNAEQFFIPASLMKIPTSVVAVALLGGDYQFTTSLEYEGHIDHEKTLEGNLWIRGGGDPTTSLTSLLQWETDLQSLITKINGTLFIDTSCFETALAPRSWSFEDLGNYYGAGASGLTLNQNTYYITFQPGEKENDPTTVIKIDPPIPNLTFYNEVTTGSAGSGDQVCVFGSEYSPIQFYRGSIPIDQTSFTIKAAIPDPALLCGLHLSKKLKPTKGIKLIREKNASISQQTVITRYKSVSLKELLQPMNQFSINLYAEHLLKAIGQGNSKQGTKRIEYFLKDLHIPSQVHDGAGLSRTNLLTPKGMVTLLSYIKISDVYLPIYISLPELSQTGTLRFFPKIPHAHLRAKSGSMSNIYNLAGYITLRDKKQYAFSIFCNHYKGPLKEIKKEIALFLDLLVEGLDQ
ncbi:D-alanyl-D-alanine carboxypeptidase/D-alanyl-D-alanine endopeptidase [Candidatus Rhabdochlamydia porcellionis]|jgi:serine-type D-Ala-D-Ala carboxypeptidase/endopeptidase (penicillin-binding protein 4)|uniref:D-alanyl-D-alanine carboxypeptidase DacB n=1 Tax=Candidatus Rhabdochlamydia porcellionis TaxID=225148 RepID=A0ABX8Z211_9BACT|nr:D-alanyl-D-alanine carboxypeptidase/D-alanyl-D-alanine-endopeptidase [Candidatus Rhabdochlamydia porcellionis]QZA58958.1 D-alanyl-D-alanine carboxypeptidase DacB [Candidatus Rhabdochlamydia porcellionis]